ncbi:MAG: hypothetical protein ABMA64_16730 [Myxococcota bacterium]
MEIEVVFRVQVSLEPITRLLGRRKAAAPDLRLVHLQELQRSLAADPERLRQVSELLGLRAVAEHFAKDLHECEDYGFDLQLAELLRPLVPRLSEEARAWLEPALSHWAWLLQSEDGAEFLGAVRCEVVGPEVPYHEPDARDEAMLAHYVAGGEPTAAPPANKPKRRR